MLNDPARLKLQLFTTAGCHLCEQAEVLIQHSLQAGTYHLELVEISESDELVERYGIRIPVLRREDLSREIGWPFAAEDVLELAQQSA